MASNGAGIYMWCRSDVVAYSFYATKNLTTAREGWSTTHNQPLLESMRSLCLTINKDAWNRYSDAGTGTTGRHVRLPIQPQTFSRHRYSSVRRQENSSGCEPTMRLFTALVR